MTLASAFLKALRLAGWDGYFPNPVRGDAAAKALDIALNSTGIVPIGSIVAWTSNITGTPALPANFKKCDGTAISDARSPMNGQSVPNLNTGAGGNGFLRGNSTSGTLNAANLGQHTHLGNGAQGGASGTLTLPNHIHSTGGLTNFLITGGATLASGSTGGAATSADTGNPTANPAIGGSTSGPSGGDATTRIEPASMDVIWVIRIF